MLWPNNADGDVFRRLEIDNFDFSQEYEIDFNIDFDHWPLTDKEREYILSQYSDAEFIYPDEEEIEEGIESGYVLLTFRSKLTYEYVMNMQKLITNKTSIIGGVCESWGLLHGNNA